MYAVAGEGALQLPQISGKLATQKKPHVLEQDLPSFVYVHLEGRMQKAAVRSVSLETGTVTVEICEPNGPFHKYHTLGMNRVRRTDREKLEEAAKHRALHRNTSRKGGEGE